MSVLGDEGDLGVVLFCLSLRDAGELDVVPRSVTQIDQVAEELTRVVFGEDLPLVTDFLVG